MVFEAETGSSFQLTANHTDITIDSLHPYYTYHCTIVAVTTSEGPHSAVIIVQTKEAG